MPKNRLIITYWDTTPSKHSVKNESMRCTSEAGADRILSKIPQLAKSHANFYDKNGQQITYSYNTV